MESNNIEKEIRNRRSRRRMRLNFGFIGNIVLFLPRMLVAVLVSLVKAIVFCINIPVTYVKRIGIENLVYSCVLIIFLGIVVFTRFVVASINVYEDGPGKEVVGRVNSLFSYLPVSPLLVGNYYVKDSLSDYLVSNYNLYGMIEESNIKKIDVPNGEGHSEITYKNALTNNLEITGNVDMLDLESSPNVETFSLKGGNDFDAVDCENLREIEFLEGDHEWYSITITNCDKLEKIILPESVESISLDLPESGYPEIISDNQNLWIELYVPSQYDVLTIEGKSNQNLTISLGEYHGDELIVTGVNAVEIDVYDSSLTAIYLEEGIKEIIDSEQWEIGDAIEGAFSENKIHYFIEDN